VTSRWHRPRVAASRRVTEAGGVEEAEPHRAGLGRAASGVGEGIGESGWWHQRGHRGRAASGIGEGIRESGGRWHVAAAVVSLGVGPRSIDGAWRRCSVAHGGTGRWHVAVAAVAVVSSGMWRQVRLHD
jgi:hypothetical protein